MKRFPLFCVVVLVAVLAGCASVGTDFHRPDFGRPASWPSVEAPVDERWWLAFDDARLAGLMQRAASANLDIGIAAARLQQARALRRGTASNAQPQLSADGGYQRGRSSANGLLDASGHEGHAGYDLWGGEVTASWEPDFWGRLRREVEAADAGIEVAVYDRDAVQLQVLAETASDYLQLRGVQATLAVTGRNLERSAHNLRLAQMRFDEGVVSRLDVAEAAAQRASVQAGVPLLEQRRSQLTNALGLLLAETPGSLSAELEGEAVPVPQAPAQFSVGLPSELAERRPDIRRAEARLHAATAAIGVAQGDFYPRIRLSGDIGLQSLQLADLGSWGSRQFALGPQVSLPIFDGGRLRSVLLLRQAQQEEAALQYRRTVLAAWHEIDDSIALYRARQQRREALAEAVRQGRIALEAAQRQYTDGAVDFVAVLTVQGALLASEQQLVDTTTGVSLALVALYKALGSGWPVS